MSEIHTVEELAALPAGSVLRNSVRELMQISHLGGGVWMWTTAGAFELADALKHFSPLTLLYRPDWPSQADLRAAVDAALELHVRDQSGFCNECGDEYFHPCPTRRALDPEEDK